jgi:EAL domain-containing protein (putative c-di-GMP-specific phosphodiesterase class I)
MLQPSLLEFSDTTAQQIEQVCCAVRSHLGMDIGFVRGFGLGADRPDDICARRATNGEPGGPGWGRGGDPWLPVAAAADPTSSRNMGAPIRLADAGVYGALCCSRRGPEPALSERDLGFLHACADIIARLIQSELLPSQQRFAKIARIRQVMRERQFAIVYQPIYRLSDNSLAGFEALTRFLVSPSRPPQQWFIEAQEVGLGAELEFATIGHACEALASLPQDVSLAVNISPASILSPAFKTMFDALPVDRLVLEVTEHAAISNYAEIKQALKPFRRRGLRLAVDDAGAGYNSFKHVLDLKPDLIKLDISLTRAINRDPARRALADALTQFGRAMGSQIVAEGVESAAELEMLRAIGVTKVQGYLVGRPMPLAEAGSVPVVRTEEKRRCRSAEKLGPSVGNGVGGSAA